MSDICLIFVELKNINQWNGFLTNFAKNWKGHFTANRDRSLKLSGTFTVYSSFQKLVRFAKIGTLLLFSTAIWLEWPIKEPVKSNCKFNDPQLQGRWSFVLHVFRSENFLTNKKFCVLTFFWFFKKTSPKKVNF